MKSATWWGGWYTCRVRARPKLKLWANGFLHWFWGFLACYGLGFSWEHTPSIPTVKIVGLWVVGGFSIQKAGEAKLCAFKISMVVHFGDDPHVTVHHS